MIQNLNKNNKQESKIADFIGWALLFYGTGMFFSGTIWTFTTDDTDKWFSRFSISLICFGFAGVIFRLRNLKICNDAPSLPSHIDAGIEAKNYGDKVNKLSDKPNGFHELDFYNGTIWFRQKIEDTKE